MDPYNNNNLPYMQQPPPGGQDPNIMYNISYMGGPPTQQQQQQPNIYVPNTTYTATNVYYPISSNNNNNNNNNYNNLPSYVDVQPSHPTHNNNNNNSNNNATGEYELSTAAGGRHSSAQQQQPPPQDELPPEYNLPTTDDPNNRPPPLEEISGEHGSTSVNDIALTTKTTTRNNGGGAGGGNNEEDMTDIYGTQFVANAKHGNQESLWESGFFGLNVFSRSGKKRLQEISEMNRVQSTDDLGKNHVQHHKKYTVMRTARGQPYLLKTGLGLDEIKEVQNEFSSIRLKFCCKWKELEDHFGLGVRLYFDFGRLIIILNCLLLFFQLVNFIPHLIVDSIYIETFQNFFKGEFSNYGGLIDILYGSSYSPQLYWLWIVTNILCILATLGFGPLYWLIVRRSFQKRDVYDMEEHDLAVAFDRDADIIKENVSTTRWHRLGRYFVSYSLFILFLLISCAITVGFTILQNFTTIYEAADAVFSQNTLYLTLISIAISVVIGLVNFLWKQICVSLTNFEKHHTWSGYRTHNTFKYLFFKLFNVFFMGFTKGLFNVPCVIRTLGNQYLIQMLLDFLVFNSIELVLPYISYFISKRRNKGSDEGIRPDFDVSEEFLEVIYRQYLIYSGMASFPMITLIAVAASILELYLDKWRLVKLCKKPPMTNGSVKTVVSFFLIVAAVLPILNWGGGNVYPLAGVYWCNTPNNLECEPCRVLDGREIYIENFVNMMYGYS